MFVDERTITIVAGKGGDGAVHWRREKFLAKGGPDGGNGGNGGDAYIEAVRNIRVLERCTEKEVLRAKNGQDGKGVLRDGKGGDAVTVLVPVGSVVLNTTTLERFEMLEEGQRVLVATGGRGGFGNAHFKSSVNTTPATATAGQEGQSYQFRIELRIIADVGIVGFPNAGKSTLLNTLTNASARVAAYPFTTLEPNLGMFHGYTLADIPGLIEKAAQGKGLGHKFLRHISRTRMLVHLVSAEEDDPLKAYHTVRDELLAYDKTLLEKKEIIVLSKTDMVDPAVVQSRLSKLPQGAMSLTVLDDDSVVAFSKALSQALAPFR
ncbi:MAG: GTPase ObgE [Candidatus Kaiserbacteria bacterium]|nr:GTPase ObgE [Candidatus Kaiserbacteria bacterium]